ncbi:PIN domain-containing protein [uncultured Chryseobacterium sp.]|uniref:PIN domain-containing protein n=1 Tax=uncultured Chryseobacterium sp. TaxID=259322 RepID=UPI002588FC2D|nr:PIN domain-containing protein [uncultured Chryseobacterium sp.]
MRILLDTNIIVHREASKVHNKDIGLLFNWLDKLHYEKCIHPITIEEIKTYKDSDVVDTMKIKLENYNELKTVSKDTPEIAYLRESDKNVNDSNDTTILNELLNDRVNFLITEDKGIHRKAKFLGVEERVYKIDSFIEKLVFENPGLTDYKVLSVKKEYFGNIKLEDPFFDSFKEDYTEFESWFNSKSDKESYVCLIEGEVKAFLFLKVENKTENYNDINPLFSAKKRLKIGTFKVTSTGLKLGERFLKVIFDNALINRVDEIYVTIFEKREEQQRLIDLLEEWGFEYWGTKTTKNGIENVYIRDFSKKITKDPRYCYPYINRKSRIFLNPIWPDYHTELFPDSYLNNESPMDYIENQPHRNAIKKIYISRSHYKDLVSGDIILFYRTGGYHQSVISTIGVVESVITNIESEDEFIRLCRKRSIFSDDELKIWWNYNPRNRPFILNFLYIDTFPMPKVNLKRLIEMGIIKSIDDAPRGFVQIKNDKFDQFLKEARANESYIVD